MKRQRASLGELCSLVKGTSPISKTRPGPYTLVTTGEMHKTADSFQLETEAVCIPLISSTGHGHASLKRVHYQTGKFALANLLAAAIVKDHSVLSAKFLTRYLMFSKDRLIVPLMTGAANMSISLDRLATVPIEFPPLAEQERIANLLDEADELRKLRDQADNRAAALIPAIFNEMFGKPTQQSKQWQMATLSQVCKFIGGTSLPSGIPFLGQTEGLLLLKVGDMNESGNETFINKSREWVSSKILSYNCAPAGTIVIPKRGGAIATNKKRMLLRDALLDPNLMGILPNDKNLHLEYLFEWFRQFDLTQITSGSIVPQLNKQDLAPLKIVIPPQPLQEEFAQRVIGIRKVETIQSASRQYLETLFQSIQHRALGIVV